MNEWTIDADLGIAVREVGGNLRIRVLDSNGERLLGRAIRATCPMGARCVNGDECEIPPAHRAAFARALSPIAEPHIERDHHGRPSAEPEIVTVAK